jgi:hypothetical protein
MARGLGREPLIRDQADDATDLGGVFASVDADRARRFTTALVTFPDVAVAS